jgi:acetyltransferase-like isoleucine patch superfamily enzyme
MSLKDPINFFSKKIAVYSIKELVWLELEAYLGWFFRSWPSFLGFIPRFIVCKLFFKKLSSFCVIQPNVYIVHGFRIKCGSNFAVNSNTYINAVGGLEIGNNVLLGPNIVISSGEHQYTDKKLPVMLQKIVHKKIIIEDGVWIGANAVIMPGITLGEGTIVGAGAVVTKSTEPYSIVGGVPARKIKNRFD